MQWQHQSHTKLAKEVFKAKAFTQAYTYMQKVYETLNEICYMGTTPHRKAEKSNQHNISRPVQVQGVQQCFL